MKKILTFAFALLMCFCPVLFSACGKSEEKSINMNRYFKSEVVYEVQGGKGVEQKDKLSTFTDNKFDNATQYTYVKFTGESSWLYKMTLEKITFKLYSNKTETLQFKISISNLSSYDLRDDDKKVVSVDAKANEVVDVSFRVGDFFKSNSATTTIKIEIDGSQFYRADGDKDTGLKIDISGFKVFGSHDLSKVSSN